MDFYTIIILIIYFAILIGTGLYWYAKTKTSADFALGSRSINYWVTAIAAHASDMSAWLFMGYPAAIYTQGMLGSWIAVGLIIGMLLTWQFIAEKLRTITEQYNSVTLPSFYEARFGDTTGIVRIVSGIVTIIFFTFYIAAGLTGMGRVFESVFEINYHTGVLIGLFSAIAYLMIGGFMARAWNDFFQGMFLLFIIMIVPIYGIYVIGGIDAIRMAAYAKNIPLTPFPSYSLKTFLEILNGFMWGVGYFGMPHILVNFMGIDNPKNMKKAQYIGMTWQIITLLSATAIGLVGIAYFFTPLANSELVFVTMAQTLFLSFFAAIILCAILAATMTTIDTQILVTASTLTEDISQKFFGSSKNNSSLWMSRAGILIISFCAYMIAFNNSSTVMGLVSYAWSGLGSAFSVVTIAALYGNRANKWGVLAAIISGSIVSGLWPLVDTALLPLIPGSVSSLLALHIVSALTHKLH